MNLNALLPRQHILFIIVTVVSVIHGFPDLLHVFDCAHHALLQAVLTLEFFDLLIKENGPGYIF